MREDVICLRFVSDRLIKKIEVRVAIYSLIEIDIRISNIVNLTVYKGVKFLSVDVEHILWLGSSRDILSRRSFLAE